MRLLQICLLFVLLLGLYEAKKVQHGADTDDNDFAEFEDFDDDEGMN